MLVAGAVDDEHLRIARDLHLRSVITVPLVARDRVLGVITWVSAESERLYTASDLALAEDLAKRAAVAIDNAELHSETLATAVQLQHAVLPESMPRIARLGDRDVVQPGRPHRRRRRLLRRRPAGRRPAGAVRRRRHGARRGGRRGDGADAGRRPRVHRDRPDAERGDDQPRPDVRPVPHRPAGDARAPRGRPGPRRARGDQRRPPAAGAAAGRPRAPSSCRWPTVRRSARRPRRGCRRSSRSAPATPSWPSPTA